MLNWHAWCLPLGLLMVTPSVAARRPSQTPPGMQRQLSQRTARWAPPRPAKRRRHRLHHPTAHVLNNSLASWRGKLPWPLPGSVQVAFGPRVELAFGTLTAQHGWDIAAAAGAPVRSIAAGQVVYAGWLQGYGQLLIIDHGAGYHVVLAHLAKRDVALNTYVKAGQQVGRLGHSGTSRGSLLYFEIRHHGVPLDPAVWLRL